MKCCSCNRKLGIDDKFCSQCGEKVSDVMVSDNLMTIHGDCEMDIRNAMSRYADSSHIALCTKHRQCRNTVEFKCANSECKFHMVFKQGINDIWRVKMKASSAQHNIPIDACQTQSRKRSKHPYSHKQLEEIVLQMFKKHPKSTAKQIADCRLQWQYSTN